MNDQINAITNALDTGNYYTALVMTIMLPSICGALESSDGHDTENKYKDWYTRYINNLSLDARNCYKLRCSLLHQASTIHTDSSFSRVIFTFPTIGGHTFHNMIINEALQLDIPKFCEEFIEGVKKWQIEMKYNTNYINNVTGIIKFHPDGLPPFIVGQPVLS